MKSKWAIGCIAVAFSLVAVAKDEVKPAVKITSNPVEFKALCADLQTQMAPGGRYQFVKPEEHHRIDGDMARIQVLLEKQSSGTALSAQEVAEQMTVQDEINAILQKRDGDRLVCERIKPIGSNVPVTSCVTYADKEKQRANSAEFLRTNQDRNPQNAH